MSGMDMQETQEAVNSLKHFNGRAKKDIKALQKQLKKIKKSSITKESHKAELLLRRRETIEKFTYVRRNLIINLTPVNGRGNFPPIPIRSLSCQGCYPTQKVRHEGRASSG